MQKTNNKINVILSCLCSASQPLAQRQRDPEQQSLKMTVGGAFDAARAVKAFTLVELLVVVLIIGVLSAIAIPMYQGAVDKSHWSTLLPGAKALKDAQEAVRMSNGLYTSNMENLDVRMPSGEVQYTLETVNDDGTANVVRATSSKLPMVRLSNYLDENTFFAGQLHCEVKDGDERATRLCEKLLGGQELNTEGNYTRYLLDQSIDKATCGHANLVWSNKQTSCYRTEEARCTANGMPYDNSTNFCGYKDRSNVVIEEGGICDSKIDAWTSCSGLTINEGGVCLGHKAYNSNRGSCDSATVNGGIIICDAEGSAQCGAGSSTFDHGICVGNDYYNCHNGKFQNGSICYANAPGACHGYNMSNLASLYDDTSCCCGDYCYGNSPKCADRGIACDPQYLKTDN